MSALEEAQVFPSLEFLRNLGGGGTSGLIYYYIYNLSVLYTGPFCLSEPSPLFPTGLKIAECNLRPITLLLDFWLYLGDVCCHISTCLL